MPDAAKIQFDAFISHSSHDTAVSQAVCRTLESAGLRCWIAPRDIVPGTRYAEAIAAAIPACRCLVLVFSNHANQSTQVATEIERAVSQHLNILPILMDKTPMSAELLYFLSRFHWMDATQPPLEPHLEKLPGLIQQLLAGKLRGASAGVWTARKVIWLCALLALLVSAGASYLVKPPPPEIKPTLKLFHDRGGTNKSVIDANYGSLSLHNFVELQASKHPGHHRYVLEILADGKAKVYTQEDFQNTPQDTVWKYEITDPAGPMSLILLVTKKPLSESARQQLAERISAVQPRPAIAPDTQIVWRDRNWTTEVFTGKGPVKDYDQTWANEVRAVLTAEPELWFDGRTILIKP